MFEGKTRFLDREPARGGKGERDRERAHEVRRETKLSNSVHREQLLHGESVD